MLGMLGLGAVGVVTGAKVQGGITKAFGPVGPQLTGLIPAAGGWRIYTVVDSVQRVSPADYRLVVRGLVNRPGSFAIADLNKLPQSRLVADFHCVTGWSVPKVPWTGVLLPDLLDAVGVRPGAAAVRFTSFDGAYTESLTFEQARRRDVIVATGMLYKPVSFEHGGPVRMYVGGMYGYKSTKWLHSIELVTHAAPGYWEQQGYDGDAWIGHSNGYTT
jgi:DMSO/TMAO reductase YedYZ molybdopterin-dependent catalytic subunit